jgi:type IV pilus assembly protein PilV
MEVYKSKQSGSSLVELMIAIVVLAIGLLGLAELQITAMRSNSKSGANVAAAMIAQMAVEEIMAVHSESDDLYGVLSTAVDVYTDWPLGASETLAGVGEYSLQYKSAPDYPPGSESGITMVEIRVTPQGGTGLGIKPVDVLAMKDLRRIYNE